MWVQILDTLKKSKICEYRFYFRFQIGRTTTILGKNQITGSRFPPAVQCHQLIDYTYFKVHHRFFHRPGTILYQNDRYDVLSSP